VKQFGFRQFQGCKTKSILTAVECVVLQIDQVGFMGYLLMLRRAFLMVKQSLTARCD
jgi:hypothetical protein